MIKLKNLLKEGSGFFKVDPGPKRWYKPYGDKYTEYEKATNKNLKEYGGAEFSEITALMNGVIIAIDKFEDQLKEPRHKSAYRNARKKFMDVVSKTAFEHEGLHEAALPKFKTPYEAYSWIMNKRGEAMDIETEMMNTSAEIQDKYKDMEQEAEPAGGPIQARYAKEIEALELQHKNLRAQFAAVMAEIDEYDQNY